MKKVLSIVAIATIFLISCQKEIENNQAQQIQKGITLKASIEELASTTKAEINTSNELVWVAGDQIGVYVDDSSWGEFASNRNTWFNLDGAGGSTSGNFIWHDNGGVFDNENAKLAFFPWQGAGDGYNRGWAETVYIELPSYYGSSTEADLSYKSGQMLTPLVAEVTRTASAYDPIEFKHAGAAVKVTINNLPVGAHSIGMTVDQQVYGSYQIAKSDFGTNAMTLNESANTSKNSVWLNFVPRTSEGSYTFLFPVPTLVTPKLSFQIWDKNGVKVWEKKYKAQPNNLGRGEVLATPAMTISPYDQFVASSDWTVIGTANGTNWDTDIAMITDGDICIAKGVSFNANSEFKVRKNKEWDTAFPSSNFKVENAGTYDIFFTISTGDIELKETGCPYPDVSGSAYTPAITIDGNLDDWTGKTAIATPPSNTRIKEWKYASDAKNVYFYYKIDKSKIKYDSGSYNYGSYLYIGFDIDGDGAEGSGSGQTGSGLEALALVYPWRGTTEGSPEIFEGLDKQGWIQCPKDTDTESKVATNGKFDGDYCYIEVSLPWDKIGNPVNGFTVNHAMNFYPTGRTRIYKDGRIGAVINAEDVTVDKGQTLSLGANTNSSAAITYSVADPTIATVNSAGEVTGVAAGTTTVTMRVAEVSGAFTSTSKTITVTVFQPAISVDGDMSDWESVTTYSFAPNTNRIRVWKFTSDSNRLYFYFELRRNRVDSAKTLYIGLDTDNDSSTGSSYGNVLGCDGYIKSIPFTNEGEATDPEPVNGLDSASRVYLSGVSDTSGIVYLKAYDGGGDLSSDTPSIFVEMSVPRDKFNFTSGQTITIGCSYDWAVTGTQSITIN